MWDVTIQKKNVTGSSKCLEMKYYLIQEVASFFMKNLEILLGLTIVKGFYILELDQN